MKKTINLASIALILLACSVAISAQKKAPDYKIAAIHITPFDASDGKFQDEIKVGDEKSFFNDLTISLLVVVEVAGQKEAYESTRKVEITVMEGKKLKKKKIEGTGILNSDGRFFVPLWLDPAMCDEVTITARLIGQRTVSRTVRKVLFECGE